VVVLLHGWRGSRTTVAVCLRDCPSVDVFPQNHSVFSRSGWVRGCGGGIIRAAACAARFASAQSGMGQQGEGGKECIGDAGTARAFEVEGRGILTQDSGKIEQDAYSEFDRPVELDIWASQRRFGLVVGGGE